MKDMAQGSQDYDRIEQAIQFIEDNFKSQPTLEQIAASVNLSKYHFNRLFKRWAGISPVQFLQYTTLRYTKQRLAQAQSVLDTSLDAGLSGPSRLHDLFVTFEAMTPGEFKQQAAGLSLAYDFSPSPFGECLIATSSRGICHFGFVSAGRRSNTLAELQHKWPEAKLVKRPGSSRKIVASIFDVDSRNSAQPFNLVLKGTNFQTRVWRALLSIPSGFVASYRDVAHFIGHPQATRAVAGAVAVNPVAYLIPCHRVIAATGHTHGYRWGPARKKAIIGWEAARLA